MCTEVEIRRTGMRSLYCGSVRDLARHLRVVVPVHYDTHSRNLSRMATHCLCPVDIHASAEASGFRVVAEPYRIHPDIVIQKQR